MGLSFAMDVEKNGAELMVDALGNKKQRQVLETVKMKQLLLGSCFQLFRKMLCQ